MPVLSSTTIDTNGASRISSSMDFNNTESMDVIVSSTTERCIWYVDFGAALNSCSFTISGNLCMAMLCFTIKWIVASWERNVSVCLVSALTWDFLKKAADVHKESASLREFVAICPVTNQNFKLWNILTQYWLVLCYSFLWFSIFFHIFNMKCILSVYICPYFWNYFHYIIRCLFVQKKHNDNFIIMWVILSR